MIGITTSKMIGEWRNIAINLTRSRSTAWPAGHRGLRTAPASPGAGRREPPDIAAGRIIDGRGALAVGLSAADDPASGIVIGDRALAVGGRAAEAVAARIVVRARLLRRGSAKPTTRHRPPHGTAPMCGGHIEGLRAEHREDLQIFGAVPDERDSTAERFG